MALLAGIPHPSNQLSLLTIVQLTENRWSNRSRLWDISSDLSRTLTQVQGLLIEGRSNVSSRDC